MKVNRVGTHGASGIGQVGVSIPANWPETISFQEQFNYSDIDPDAYNRQDVDDEAALVARIFSGLIRKCLLLGLDIHHGKKKRMGDYVIEAAFFPKSRHPRLECYLYLPIEYPGNLIAKDIAQNEVVLAQHLATYVDAVLRQMDNKSLINLLIVSAHEFGHFLSFCHGNHNAELAQGLMAMHRDMVIGNDRYTSLVFIEESNAWRYAHEQLERLEFVWWDIYDAVKFDSLRAYFAKLELAKATTSVFAKLSMIEDFRKSADSAYFKKTPPVK